MPLVSIAEDQPTNPTLTSRFAHRHISKKSLEKSNNPNHTQPRSLTGINVIVARDVDQ
jgi:hypothetical protein